LAGITRVEDAKAGASLPRNEDWVTRQGYLRERRGGRFAAPDQPRFGRARLEALRDELEKIKRNIEPLQTQMRTIGSDIQQIKDLLAGVDATTQLAARAAEFAEAKTQYDTLLPARRALGEKSHEAMKTKLALEKKLLEERTNESRLAQTLEMLAKEIAEKENKDGWAEQVKRLERLAHDKQILPIKWQDVAENRKLQDEWRDGTNIDRRIHDIEAKFKEGTLETDESVILLRNKIKADFETQSKDLETRRRDNDTARHQTDAAREQYIKVLRHTVGRYTKNLKVLGDMAGIAVDHEAVMLSADDVSLSQAGLVVRFGFDDKGFAGMNDGDASGGQQVMKSLILLVALMMEDSRPGGFVFIDEPFAHLDIFNIKRVASFLQATKAQYLLTTPVTHNVNVYDPSMLTLVTSKKKADTQWAPRVGVLVREKS
jgi:chromosome segregation ATPase